MSQYDLDYDKTITNLSAKLRRQKDAAAETEAQITAFKQLQEQQKKEATKK